MVIKRMFFLPTQFFLTKVRLSCRASFGKNLFLACYLGTTSHTTWHYFVSTTNTTSKRRNKAIFVTFSTVNKETNLPFFIQTEPFPDKFSCQKIVLYSTGDRNFVCQILVLYLFEVANFWTFFQLRKIIATRTTNVSSLLASTLAWLSGVWQPEFLIIENFKRF